MSDRRTDLGSDADVARQVAREVTAGMHTAIPGRVLSYDRTEQRATVQPVVRASRRDPVTGERVSYLPPPIPNCPVVFPGSGSVSLTWDLQAGDPCVLMFAERSIDEWLSTAEVDNEPADLRRFDLTDAFVIPGARPFSDPLPSAAYASGAAVLRASDLRLGSSAASDPVALSSLVTSNLNALKTTLNAWVPVAGDGGLALKTLLTTLLSTWPTSVAASKVRAE